MLYHYCSFQETAITCLDILASLVDQLLRAEGPLSNETIMLFNRECRRSRQSSDVTTLSEFLKQLLEIFAHVYLLIDALDEFSHLDDLVELLDLMHGWNLPQLHILLTSQRHDGTIIDYVDHSILPRDQIDVASSGMDADIRFHIRRALEQTSRRHGWPRSLLTDIEDALTKGAAGS